jgi:hypothetical protein
MTKIQWHFEHQNYGFNPQTNTIIHKLGPVLQVLTLVNDSFAWTDGPHCVRKNRAEFIKECGRVR